MFKDRLSSKNANFKFDCNFNNEKNPQSFSSKRHL